MTNRITFGIIGAFFTLIFAVYIAQHRVKKGSGKTTDISTIPLADSVDLLENLTGPFYYTYRINDSSRHYTFSILWTAVDEEWHRQAVENGLVMIWAEYPINELLDYIESIGLSTESLSDYIRQDNCTTWDEHVYKTPTSIHYLYICESRKHLILITFFSRSIDSKRRSSD